MRQSIKGEGVNLIQRSNTVQGHDQRQTIGASTMRSLTAARNEHKSKMRLSLRENYFRNQDKDELKKFNQIAKSFRGQVDEELQVTQDELSKKIKSSLHDL